MGTGTDGNRVTYLVAGSLFVLLAGSVLALWLALGDTDCKRTVVSRNPSSSGRLVAELSEYDCGATTEITSFVRIVDTNAQQRIPEPLIRIRPSQHSGSGPTPSFAAATARASIETGWRGDDTLIVTFANGLLAEQVGGTKRGIAVVLQQR